MSDVDTVERVASAMWESRGNASTWDDAENTALVSIYRNLARAAIAALPPAVPDTTPDPVAEAAKVLEQELNLAALIESLDGNEAHRIMPHIWPILCKYVALTKDGEAG